MTNFVEVNQNQPCIAHAFKEAGYETGFIGKWHLCAGVYRYADKHESRVSDKYAAELSERYGVEGEALVERLLRIPGLDFVPPGPGRLGFDYWAAFNFHTAFRKPWYYADTPERLFMDGYETDAETQLAIDFMTQCRERDVPFFLVVAPHPPHPPFSPNHCPQGYLDAVPEDLWHPPNVPADHPRRVDPMELRCYYAMAKNMDDNVGKLTAFLDEAGLSEDTLMVLTSDHGEQHGSHGRTNKMVPYAESVRVPLIMRWPGHVPAGRRTDALQTPLDHLPTLCSLAGVPADVPTDGDDLRTVVLGEAESPRDAVLMMNYTASWDFFQSGTVWPEWRGVKTKRHTYVKWLTGEEELYDDMDDPYQMVNLAENQAHAAVVDSLRLRLEELLSEANDTFPPGTAYADWYDDERNLVAGPINT